MDANKLKVLQDLPYRIQKTCGLCRHRLFVRDSPWGVCATQTYEHQKHTGAPRQLSIHRSGYCPKFEADPAALNYLEGFRAFFEG